METSEISQVTIAAFQSTTITCPSFWLVSFGLIMAEINHQGTVTMPDSFIIHWFIKVNLCKKNICKFCHLSFLVNLIIQLQWQPELDPLVSRSIGARQGLHQRVPKNLRRPVLDTWHLHLVARWQQIDSGHIDTQKFREKKEQELPKCWVAPRPIGRETSGISAVCIKTFGTHDNTTVSAMGIAKNPPQILLPNLG